MRAAQRAPAAPIKQTFILLVVGQPGAVRRGGRRHAAPSCRRGLGRPAGRRRSCRQAARLPPAARGAGRVAPRSARRAAGRRPQEAPPGRARQDRDAARPRRRPRAVAARPRQRLLVALGADASSVDPLDRLIDEIELAWILEIVRMSMAEHDHALGSDDRIALGARRQFRRPVPGKGTELHISRLSRRRVQRRPDQQPPHPTSLPLPAPRGPDPPRCPKPIGGAPSIPERFLASHSRRPSRMTRTEIECRGAGSSAVCRSRVWPCARPSIPGSDRASHSRRTFRSARSAALGVRRLTRQR
jgi:hypothetical protein